MYRKRGWKQRSAAWWMILIMVFSVCFSGMDVHAEGPAGGSEVTLTAVKNGYTQGNMATLGKNATGMAEMQGYLRVKYANDVKDTTDTYKRRAYVAFDLSGVTEEMAEKALLQLTVKDLDNNYSNSQPYYVGSVKADMDTIAWESFDVWQEPADKVAIPADGGMSAGGRLETDVTDIVKAALANGEESITFCIYIPTKAENNGINLYSTAAENAAQRPGLKLTAGSESPEIPVIQSLEDASCTVQTGGVLNPPSTVKALMSDGSNRDVAVVWNQEELNQVDLTATGTYNVSGTVEGSTLKAALHVIVVSDQTGKESTVVASEDTYVAGGGKAAQTGAQMLAAESSAVMKDRLRLKYTDGVDQAYTRRVAMKFDLSALTTEGMDQYLLYFQTHDGEANNPGEHFSSFNIYTFEKEAWTRSGLTWNELNAVLSQTADTLAATVSAADRIRTVQLNNPSYVYEVDVTDAVQKALEQGKTEISFAFVVPTRAANNQHDIFSATSTRENVQKPSLTAKESPYIQSAENTVVTTVVGTAPALPQTVTAHYKDGTSGQEAVAWNPVDPTSYGSIGKFTVTGILLNNPAITVTAEVTVRLGDDYAGTTYYVSSSLGDDGNDGLSIDTPWKSLNKVNTVNFLPGDKILFKAGDIWNGYLRPMGSGDEKRPILLSSYGNLDQDGRPVINGGGTTYSRYSAAIMLVNQQYWKISNFEVTNYGAGQAFGQRYTEPYVRAGIYLFTYDQNELMKDLTVENCYVHDVVSNTTDSVSNTSAKMSGGIIALAEFRTPDGNQVVANTNNQSGFDGVKLQYNTVYRTMHEGIRTKVEGAYNTSNPNAYNRTCRNISINNNYIEDTLGDGIVLGEASSNAVVEKNVVNGAASVPLNSVYYAAVWTHYATDVLFQYNEVYGTVYGQSDGQAFDADNFCYNSTFQYNYSHDNQGGALLLMGSQRDTVYRYNVSANDATGNGQEIFQDHSNNGTSAGAPTVYNNTFYIVKNNVYLFSSRSTTGSPEYVTFLNNIVDVKEGVRSANFSKASGIAAGSTIKNNLFAYEGLFGINENSWPGNYYGDPQLVNPGAYQSHSTGLADVRTLAEVEELKADPLKNLRGHAAEFTPQARELVSEKGIVIENMRLTEDIMGNPINLDAPGIGAIELQAHVHTPEYRKGAEGSTVIEAYCSGCGEILGTAELKAPVDTEYDGIAKEAAVAYSDSWVANALPDLQISYVKDGLGIPGLPVEAGSYTASGEIGGIIVSVEFTINEVETSTEETSTEETSTEETSTEETSTEETSTEETSTEETSTEETSTEETSTEETSTEETSTEETSTEETSTEETSTEETSTEETSTEETSTEETSTEETSTEETSTEETSTEEISTEETSSTEATSAEEIESSSSTDSSADTGDHSNPIAWVLVLAIAAASMAGVFVQDRRRRVHKKR